MGKNKLLRLFSSFFFLSAVLYTATTEELPKEIRTPLFGASSTSKPTSYYLTLDQLLDQLQREALEQEKDLQELRNELEKSKTEIDGLLSWSRQLETQLANLKESSDAERLAVTARLGQVTFHRNIAIGFSIAAAIIATSITILYVTK